MMLVRIFLRNLTLVGRFLFDLFRAERGDVS